MAASTQPNGPSTASASADPRAAATDAMPPGLDAAGGHAPGGDLIGGLRALLGDLQGVVADRVELLSLELRRFGRTLGRVVVLGAVTLLLAATAWAALWVAAAAALQAAGLSTTFAVLIVAAVNLVAAGVAAGVASRQLPHLGLPATRRHLTMAPGIRPPVNRTGEAAGPAGATAAAAAMATPRPSVGSGRRDGDDGPPAPPSATPVPPSVHPAASGDRRAAAV